MEKSQETVRGVIASGLPWEGFGSGKGLLIKLKVGVKISLRGFHAFVRKP